ncbi:MAG: site-2 protease family protein, partial [Candidatus Margulisbacteria bacterium]|nr:site-2 protease family protein [Candidatus Margulisiibacteriota bacterium]
MLAVFSFLIVFGLVVLFHEAGHFLVTKLSGIKVYEFSIGFGPRIFSFKRKGTLYGINIFPLGGLVRVAGLDDLEKEKAKPQENYQNKSWGVRAGVLLAGPLMNIVLAFLIFVTVFSIIGLPEKASNKIANVFANTPAAQAGWQRGDIITEFNGEKVTNMEEVIKQIHDSRGRILSFIILRNQQKQSFALRAKYYPEQNISLLGINLKPLAYKRYSPGQAIYRGVLYTYWITKEIIKGFIKLLFGQAQVREIAGPIGIAKLSGEA